MSIAFYSTKGPYGAFSNFSAHPIDLDGQTWPTAEHYFQGQKFPGAPHQEAIRQARSPMVAARLGRSRKAPLRPDWEMVRVDVMRRAVLAKFRQHPDLADLLLGTGDQEIVEASPTDAFWGAGADGAGQNMLGRILVEVRGILRARPGAAGPDAGQDLRILHEGRFLRLVQRGTWEYVQRRNVSGVVGIVAVTNEGRMLLVEQHRPPLGQRVIELPAGLAGDVADAAGEPLADAARRELLEETGYDAARMLPLTTGPASAGLTDECITLFRAMDLKKAGSGGGDGHEHITVHEAPLASARDWLAAAAAAGKAIDLKVWAGLYFAQDPR